MELKKLTEKVLSLLEVSSPDKLGDTLMNASKDHGKLRQFKTLVGGDLSKDWLQMIYQYYLADRKEKKQDYTPKSIAKLMGALVSGSDRVVDMCAGSGALIIQKWNQNPDICFTAIEIDDGVIPFLIFNMVLRNIRCRVLKLDALTGEEPEQGWDITKGEEFGDITDFKSTL